jgi:hypothetical protein
MKLSLVGNHRYPILRGSYCSFWIGWNIAASYTRKISKKLGACVTGLTEVRT